MFRSRKGQLSSDIESYWREADEVMHKFPLSEKEEKIIENYIRKQKTTRIINRFKIINGRVISRLSKLEGLYFRTPQNIGYDSE